MAVSKFRSDSHRSWVCSSYLGLSPWKPIIGGSYTYRQLSFLPFLHFFSNVSTDHLLWLLFIGLNPLNPIVCQVPEVSFSPQIGHILSCFDIAIQACHALTLFLFKTPLDHTYIYFLVHLLIFLEGVCFAFNFDNI